MQRLSLQTLANRFGVHRSTISRALNNSPKVGAELRRQIQEAARELGYGRDPRVSEVMRQVRHAPGGERVIAILTSAASGTDWSLNHAGNNFVMGARRRAEMLGLKLEEFRLSELSDRRIDAILWSRGIEGLLIGTLDRGRERLDIRWERYSVVTRIFDPAVPEVHAVSHHYFHGALTALGELHRLGYRRIGLIQSERQDARGNYASMAALLLHGRHTGLTPPEPLVLKVWNPEEIVRWVRRERPDAVLAYSHVKQTLKILRRAGYDVPGEIGYANLNLPAFAHPVSGMDQLPVQLGEALVDRLLGLMHIHERGVPQQRRVEYINGVWNPGATTRCLTGEG